MSTIRGVQAHVLRWCLGFAGLAVGALACSGSRPSERDGEQALRARIDNGSDERFVVRAFKKEDGVAAEVSGIKIYTLMFSAEGEFVGDAAFSAGGPLSSEGRSITTRPYVPPSPGFSWNDFLAGSQGFRPAMRGDRLRINGRIQFEKRESGWHATEIALAYALDSSSRGFSTEGAKSAALGASGLERPPNSRASTDGERAAYYAALEADLKRLNYSVHGVGYSSYTARLAALAFAASPDITIATEDGSRTPPRAWSATATHARLSLTEWCTIQGSSASSESPIGCTSQLGSRSVRLLLGAKGGAVATARCAAYSKEHAVRKPSWLSRLLRRAHGIADALPDSSISIGLNSNVGAIAYLETGELCLGAEPLVSIPDLRNARRDGSEESYQVGLSAVGPRQLRVLNLSVGQWFNYAWVVHPDSLLPLSEVFVSEPNARWLWDPNGASLVLADWDLLAVHIPRGHVLTVPLNSEASLDQVLSQPECIWQGAGWAVKRTLDNKLLEWENPSLVRTRIHLWPGEPMFQNCVPADSVATVLVDISRGVVSRVP